MSNFKAVLVGINDYGGQGDLNGCVNDVLYMRDILKIKYKLEEGDIRVLTDKSATREAILERLTWLMDQGRMYKNLLFWYSGHGTRIPNQNYADDEYDGMDELICPADFDWRGKYIDDDTIHEITVRLDPQAKLSMVFDCCHSGTIARDCFFGNPVHYKSRCLPTPVDMMCRAPSFEATSLVNKSDHHGFDSIVTFKEEFFWDIDNKDILRKDIEFKKRSSIKDLTVDQNIIILSGCQDDQTSADAHFYNRYQGALSFAVQKNLMEDPDLPSGELTRRTTDIIKRFGFDQTPVLTADKEVFKSLPFLSTDRGE